MAVAFWILVPFAFAGILFLIMSIKESVEEKLDPTCHKCGVKVKQVSNKWYYFRRLRRARCVHCWKKTMTHYEERVENE